MNSLSRVVKAQGRSINWLSKNSGLSPYKIRESIKGKRQLKSNEAKILAQLLQVPPEFIFLELRYVFGNNHNISKTPPEAPGADK